MAQPLISIGLPVYNGAQYLRRALDNLLAQDCRDLELIICDNGSTDGTLEICAEYQARDARIRLHRNEQNIGAIRNFNKAFELATGKYFMWAAHDDGWEPTYISRCIAELDNNPETVLCASDLQFMNETGEPIETAWHFEPTVGMPIENRIASMLERWGWYAIYGVIRPEALRRTNLFRNVAGADLLLMLELSLQGPFAKVPDKLFRYRFFEQKTVAQSLQAMDPFAAKHSVSQFNTDIARDLWHAIAEAKLSPQTKRDALRKMIDAVAFKNTHWRNAIIAENPFPLFGRAGDQVPRAVLKRHLYRLFGQKSTKGQSIFNADPSREMDHRAILHPAVERPGVPVRWMAPIFNPSGYASEAINFILPLANRLNLGILHQNNIYSEKFVDGLAEPDRNTLFQLRDKFRSLRRGIVVSHQPANGFAILPDAEYHIGRSMYESDRIPESWVTRCNQMDEVWVPSEFNFETFAKSGVSRDKLVIIPGAVDPIEFDPEKHSPLDLPRKAARNFLSVFEWSTRKGWDVLLAAYLREFSAEDDVCLYLRTYLMSKPDGDPHIQLWRKIREFAETLDLGNKPWPRIEILAEQTATADLPRLYKAVDCLVAPSRGEGWGRPHHEAMMMGVPVIATGWSGNTAFMTKDNSYLIDYELEVAARLEPELWHYQGHQWARASETHLRGLMREVATHPEQAQQRGQKARKDMLEKFSRDEVAEQVIKRLAEIEHKLSTPACPAVLARQATPAKTKLSQKVPVAWEGSFLDFGSLSHVNRAMTAALSGHTDLRLTRVRDTRTIGTRHGLEHLVPSLKSAAPNDVALTIRHSWPPDWTKPERGGWIHIQPWEYGALPLEWVEKLQAVNQVWAYSNYVRDVYVNSGVPPEKVKVVPLGIDPKSFSPAALPRALPTEKEFKFLFVGGTIFRKGPDALVQAYLDAFTAADDVCLVIKDFGSRGVYANQTTADAIRRARLNPGAPEILILEDDLKPEEMPGLFTACDCLVHPYRGEGFGLPVLEAMACGLPVVVTAGGATDDFATDEFAFRIAATKESIGNNAGGMRLVRPGWMLEPDVLELTSRLRAIFDDPSEARVKGQRAAEHVRENWTWERSAQIAAGHVQTLLEHGEKLIRAEKAKRSRKLTSIPRAVSGALGSLDEAKVFFEKKQFSEAWASTCNAIKTRPFHPAGWLLLARIASTKQNLPLAKTCADRALSLAPEWKESRQLLKHLPTQATSSNLDQLPRLSDGSRLTVCMIVKNEERFIARCLDSIKPIAHQIIIVDTGSTDQTIELARERGAETHSFKWCDDFSAARNAALLHARGDWILCLDADEELLPESLERLKADMASQEAICYRVPLLEKSHEAEGCSYVPRLFRNAPGFFFFGRIHEQIFFSIEPFRREWGMQNKLGTGVLLHHGYSADVVHGRNKTARNLHLLELAVEEWPNEPSLLINHALELSRWGRSAEAVAQALWAIEAFAGVPQNQQAPEFREFLLTRAGQILLGAKHHNDVIRLYRSPLAKQGPLTASQHFLVGLSFLETKRYEEASTHFTACLERRNKPGLTPAIKDILKSGPHHCLGICFNRLQKYDSAEKSLRHALDAEPTSRGVRIELARVLRAEQKSMEALEILCGGIENAGRDLMFWRLGGEIALSEPELLGFALDWTSESIKNGGEDNILIQQRAEALMLSENLDAAANLWRNTDHRQNPKHAAALLLCEGALGITNSYPGFDEAVLSHGFIAWYRRLIEVGADETVGLLHEKLGRLQAHVPSAVRLLRSAMEAVETENAQVAVTV